MTAEGFKVQPYLGFWVQLSAKKNLVSSFFLEFNIAEKKKKKR
jgi:hypothetical protein